MQVDDTWIHAWSAVRQHCRQSFTFHEVQPSASSFDTKSFGSRRSHGSCLYVWSEVYPEFRFWGGIYIPASGSIDTQEQDHVHYGYTNIQVADAWTTATLGITDHCKKLQNLQGWVDPSEGHEEVCHQCFLQQKRINWEYRSGWKQGVVGAFSD